MIRVTEPDDHVKKKVSAILASCTTEEFLHLDICCMLLVLNSAFLAPDVYKLLMQLYNFFLLDVIVDYILFITTFPSSSI